MPSPVSGLTRAAASPTSSTRPSGWWRGPVESGRWWPRSVAGSGSLPRQQRGQGGEQLAPRPAAAAVEHAEPDVRAAARHGERPGVRGVPAARELDHQLVGPGRHGRVAPDRDGHRAGRCRRAPRSAGGPRSSPRRRRSPPGRRTARRGPPGPARPAGPARDGDAGSRPCATAASTSRASNTARGIGWLGRAQRRATTWPPGLRSRSPGTAGPSGRRSGTPSASSRSNTWAATPSPQVLSRGNAAASSSRTRGVGPQLQHAQGGRRARRPGAHHCDVGDLLPHASSLTRPDRDQTTTPARNASTSRADRSGAPTARPMRRIECAHRPLRHFQPFRDLQITPSVRGELQELPLPQRQRAGRAAQAGQSPAAAGQPQRVPLAGPLGQSPHGARPCRTTHPAAGLAAAVLVGDVVAEDAEPDLDHRRELGGGTGVFRHPLAVTGQDGHCLSPPGCGPRRTRASGWRAPSSGCGAIRHRPTRRTGRCRGSGRPLSTFTVTVSGVGATAVVLRRHEEGGHRGRARAPSRCWTACGRRCGSGRAGCRSSAPSSPGSSRPDGGTEEAVPDEVAGAHLERERRVADARTAARR